jgi:nucleoside-diphosphate-sugar epimerase
MRVFLTGATGFLGRHVVRRLLESGGTVTALTRDPARARALLPPEVALVPGDLTGPPPPREALAGHDVLLHAGAHKGSFTSRASDEATYVAINASSTLALARAWRDAGGGRFVHISSTAVMGIPDRLPLDEDAPCRPYTLYGRSKLAAEEGLREEAKSGLDAVIVRPCLIVGEGGGETGTIVRLVRRGLFPLIRGHERVRKPMVAPTDVADAMIAAATRGRAGAVYLVTSGTDYALEDIVATVARLVGRGGAIRVPLAPVKLVARLVGWLHETTGLNLYVTPERLELFLSDRAFAIDRARSELGYEPKVTELADLLAPALGGPASR